MHVTVSDVMTTQVCSVKQDTPFKEIAETLIAHGISAVPVVDDDNRVVGMVSEADLLRKEEFREQFYREGYKPPLRARLRHPGGREKATGDTAGELMSAPPITVSPEAPVGSAARIMETREVKRLAVVDAGGRLVGLVSRRDLIKVFTRSDVDLAAEILGDILGRVLWMDTDEVRAEVKDGVVTLSGSMRKRSEAAIAVRLTQRVNGVVDVIDKITWKEDDAKWEGR
ncbi:CBS domain-containing protein [Nonomuraea sediminis]|uniref:CBS domain-containing protein n=1 Tax=Nonomuraea sediminis TaxID=2835864 RepID=UPI001BDC6247|nr:CBS domain-containing protein [Nonomuraea sediminis]